MNKEERIKCANCRRLTGFTLDDFENVEALPKGFYGKCPHNK
jgi:DNA mismatch repair protein MutH